MSKDDKELKTASIKKVSLTQRVTRSGLSFIEDCAFIGAMVFLLLWAGYCQLTGRDMK